MGYQICVYFKEPTLEGVSIVESFSTKQLELVIGCKFDSMPILYDCKVKYRKGVYNGEWRVHDIVVWEKNKEQYQSIYSLFDYEKIGEGLLKTLSEEDLVSA